MKKNPALSKLFIESFKKMARLKRYQIFCDSLKLNSLVNQIFQQLGIKKSHKEIGWVQQNFTYKTGIEVSVFKKERVLTPVYKSNNALIIRILDLYSTNN